MAEQENQTAVVPGSNAKPPLPNKRKPIAKRFAAWDHFEAFVDKDGDEKARCIYCNKEFYGDSKRNGTTSLNNHLLKCKKLIAGMESGQTLLHFKSVNATGEVNTLTIWKFDKVDVRKALAFMIMVDELPFKFVENEGFRHLMAVACGPKFQLPSRSTLSRDCYNLYIDEKNLLKGMFKSCKQRVCLTTDTWTSLQRINYMCLTAHFIDSDWKLNKKNLNFCTISGHKGKDIGLGVEKCLSEWELERVFTITVDNTSSNDVAIDCLKEKNE